MQAYIGSAIKAIRYNKSRIEKTLKNQLTGFIQIRCGSCRIFVKKNGNTYIILSFFHKDFNGVQIKYADNLINRATIYTKQKEQLKGNLSNATYLEQQNKLLEDLFSKTNKSKGKFGDSHV